MDIMDIIMWRKDGLVCFLGFLLDENLSFNYHPDLIKMKICRHLGNQLINPENHISQFDSFSCFLKSNKNIMLFYLKENSIVKTL